MASHQVELHPSARARLARSLRFGRDIKGHWRIANLIAGTPAEAAFRVRNADGWIEGAFGSVIERQVYLLGGYEEPLIAAFLALFPTAKRGCAIDVGANIGTHSLAFSRHFSRVICFDPNQNVFASLRRNLALNPAAQVTPINVGLGDVSETRAFYNIMNGNDGLGTFLEAEQYDQPLEKVADLPIVRGDDALAELLNPGERVDAVKLDIQGYEPKALKGLRSTLAEHRPIVWVEFGNGTHNALAPGEDFVSLFPYPVDVFRFATGRTMGIARTRLERLDSVAGLVGDVVVRPRE